MAKIVDGELIIRPPTQLREVYFIQAVTIGLIKIGVADRASKRLRMLALQCPDRLAVLGVQTCNRAGALELELHRQFRAHRRHGEWFDPADEIIEHIECYAMGNRAKIRQLAAIVSMPTLKRGRPTAKQEEHIRVVLGPKWR